VGTELLLLRGGLGGVRGGDCDRLSGEEAEVVVVEGVER
jgi:hypothetical protein